MSLWAHLRRIWPRYTLLPVAPFALWIGFWIARGALRWDHVASLVLIAVLAYGSERTKQLYLCLLPLALVGVLYDAMRFVKNVGLSENNVHDCDLRELEVTLFGFVANGQRHTLHDFAQAHANRILDIFFAIPYGIFIYTVLGFAIYLVARDQEAARRFTWGFFALNLLGFITYHVYPAAPPWYYHAYGCLLDLGAKASPGPNLLRVDAMLGFDYFTGFYGRSSDVFGAVPSLHVAYPLLMCIEGWWLHRRAVRTALVGFYVWMCLAAVYLDHHWVIDVVLGTVYTVTVAVAIRFFKRRVQCRAWNVELEPRL